MTILIFEDGTHDNFYPVSQTRPLWDLRCGAFTFRQRLERLCAQQYPGVRIIFAGRSELAALCREMEPGITYNEAFTDDDLLCINALAVPLNGIVYEKDAAYTYGGRIAAAYFSKEILQQKKTVISSGADIARAAEACGLAVKDGAETFRLFSFIWNIIMENGAQIRRDYTLLDQKKNMRAQYQVTFQGDETQIYIEDNISIDPFVVIDARKGPVIICKGTEINPFTRIEGPCAVGENCLLLGAKVREGCSFGPVCKIGGEVEDAVFQSYSNKYHDGFIGHAYIGQWVNLGALTTNSDLKNDYSTVKAYLPGGIRDTGETKVGCMIGDYTKTSIGTLLNTGSVLGTGSMAVMSGRMTPPHLPGFCRFIKDEIRDPGSAQSVVDTAKTVCARRKAAFPAAMELLLHDLYVKHETLRKKEADEWNIALK